MGTSSSFRGEKPTNPLIPSWIEQNNTNNVVTPSSQESEPEQNQSNQNENSNSPKEEITQEVMPPSTSNRFRTAKVNLNKFIKSNAVNKKYLSKSVSSFIKKSMGGSSTLSKRMNKERKTAGNLLKILIDATQQGIRDTAEQYFSPESLKTLSIKEIYIVLSDHIIGSAGDLDNGLIREAYNQTLGELLELDESILEKPNTEIITLIMESFITNTIVNRILLTISNGIITNPKSVLEKENIDGIMKSYIRGAVSDSMKKENDKFTSKNINKLITKIYNNSLSILESYPNEVN